MGKERKICVLLGCNRADVLGDEGTKACGMESPKIFPCVYETESIFELPQMWRKEYLRLLNDSTPGPVPADFFNRLNNSGLIPPCETTGAKKYATSTVVIPTGII